MPSLGSGSLIASGPIMSWEITFLDEAPLERRFKDGKLWDVVDYPFRVSNGQASRTVAVGITGQSHDPSEALGSKKLSRGDLMEAAAAWLRSRLEKHECDPFNHPNTDTMIDVPPPVMEFWLEHRSIPPWI